MNTADIMREEMLFYVRAALFAPRCRQRRLNLLHAWFAHAGLAVTAHLYTHYAGPCTERSLSRA